MRSFDWSQTILGFPETWPLNLKTCVRIILTSRQPMFIWWGEQLIHLYNDGYISILGAKHPAALAKPAPTVWSEVWDVAGPRAELAMHRDEGTYDEALPFIMLRKGYPEETYVTFSYSPIPDDRGGFGGILCPASEDTARIIGERQLALLRELPGRTADARNWADACRLSAKAMESNTNDLPFALIYTIDRKGGAASLAAASGIGDMNSATPQKLALGNPDLWPLQEVCEKRHCCLVSDLAAVKEGLPLVLGYPVQQAIALPIALSGEVDTNAVLIVGLNPLRAFDDGYRSFLEMVAAGILAAMLNAETYEAERRRAEALAELDRAKTVFFSNVSHEFRTPLTLLLGPLEDELRAHPTENGRLVIAHRNALRLLKLVNTLLDFSRIEAGRIQAVYEPTSLDAYTAELASVFRSAIEKAGLRLLVECEPLPDPVYVDREMWEKIVLNLLSNAFKFTFEGEISVSLRRVGEKVELAVRDTGTGIPSHEMPCLFERFHRVKGARGRSLEGSGIGLALVQELVKLHGGAVRVESDLDRGSTFTVAIPLGVAHLPADRIESARPLTSTALHGEVYVEEALRWLPGLRSSDLGKQNEAHLPESPNTMAPAATFASGDSRPRILLADDNADMREYVGRLLRERYDVHAVIDGLEALKSAREHVPNLVLTDVMMPRLDGIGLLKELRADEQLKTVPIILLSARAGEEAKVEGVESGADDYLIKPFSARELVARVDAHLKMSRLRTEGETALRESEERMRLAIRATRMVTWEWIPSMDHIRTSDNFADVYGLPALAGAEEWFALLLSEDREAHTAKVRKVAAQGGSYNSEFRIRRADDSRVVWLEERAEAQLGSDGNVKRVNGVTLEITERKRSEERQSLLMSELSHRVKNTLATVQSIASQTFRGSREPVESFKARLQALSRTHDLLTRRNWEAADVADLVRDQLMMDGDVDRIKLHGPEASLAPQSAVALSLVLHELGTNARKYGALSASNGCLDVHWWNGTQEHSLQIDWTETGGPPVLEPRSRGFGTTLIERSLGGVGGSVNLRFHPSGLRCAICIPLAPRENESYGRPRVR
jgi:PAS domain S-box-containing protein